MWYANNSAVLNCGLPAVRCHVLLQEILQLVFTAIFATLRAQANVSRDTVFHNKVAKKAYIAVDDTKLK